MDSKRNSGSKISEASGTMYASTTTANLELPNLRPREFENHLLYLDSIPLTNEKSLLSKPN
jgi:hypothetical protein